MFEKICVSAGQGSSGVFVRNVQQLRQRVTPDRRADTMAVRDFWKTSWCLCAAASEPATHQERGSEECFLLDCLSCRTPPAPPIPFLPVCISLCVSVGMCHKRHHYIHYLEERSVCLSMCGPLSERVCVCVCVCVGVVSLFLFAWTCVFHVHCGHRCCGFVVGGSFLFFNPSSWQTLHAKTSQEGLFFFFFLQLELKRWVRPWEQGKTRGNYFLSYHRLLKGERSIKPFVVAGEAARKLISCLKWCHLNQRQWCRWRSLPEVWC